MVSILSQELLFLVHWEVILPFGLPKKPAMPWHTGSRELPPCFLWFPCLHQGQPSHSQPWKAEGLDFACKSQSFLLLMVFRNRENLKLGEASKEPGGRTKGACMYSKNVPTAHGRKGGEKGGEGKLQTAKADRRVGEVSRQSFCRVGPHQDFHNQKGASSNPGRAWFVPGGLTQHSRLLAGSS